MLISGVAQWLTCWAHNPKVRGSKPRSAMRFCAAPRFVGSLWRPSQSRCRSRARRQPNAMALRGRIRSVKQMALILGCGGWALQVGGVPGHARPRKRSGARLRGRRCNSTRRARTGTPPCEGASAPNDSVNAGNLVGTSIVAQARSRDFIPRAPTAAVGTT